MLTPPVASAIARSISTPAARSRAAASSGGVPSSPARAWRIQNGASARALFRNSAQSMSSWQPLPSESTRPGFGVVMTSRTEASYAAIARNSASLDFIVLLSDTFLYYYDDKEPPLDALYPLRGEKRRH